MTNYRLFVCFSIKGAAYIVASYAGKIENEKSWRSGPGATPLRDTAGNSNYAHVREQDGTNVPLASSHAYPYGDASHSFGGSASHHHVTTSV